MIINGRGILEPRRWAFGRFVTLWLAGFLVPLSLPSGTSGHEKGEPSPENQRRFPGRIFLANLSKKAESPIGVVALDPNDRTLQTITTETSHLYAARVSPDGSLLVQSRRSAKDEDLGLWLYKTSGDPQPLRIADRVGETCWSPDGKSILVTRYTEQLRPVYWLVAADGSREERLPIPETDNVLDWSPSNNWLLTQRFGQPGAPYYLVHLDGTGERLLLASTESVPGFGGTCAARTRFSPDGRKVLCVVAVKDGQPPVIQRNYLLRLDLDGGPPRKLYEHQRFHHSAQTFCWSPDGKSVAVRVSDGGPPTRGKPASLYLDLVNMEQDREGILIESIPWPEHLQAGIPFDWR
jgi:dipeptidyl aminopeptidase/acylaminoacyl peptidase